MAGTLQFHRVLLGGLGISTGAALLGRWLPSAVSATAVAAWFLIWTYTLALRRHQAAAPSGLAFGGLLESAPISLRKLARSAAGASALGAASVLLLAPAYWLGFWHWYRPTAPFHWHAALYLGASGIPRAAFVDLALGHLLVVALPEEAFFRGYLQSALDRCAPATFRLAGAPLGSALLTSSAVFALGHLLSVPELERLAVFFPSLLFGWLRAKSGGIGASVVAHALCNLYVLMLSAGYGLSLTPQ